MQKKYVYVFTLLFFFFSHFAISQQVNGTPTKISSHQLSSGNEADIRADFAILTPIIEKAYKEIAPLRNSLDVAMQKDGQIKSELINQAQERLVAQAKILNVLPMKSNELNSLKGTMTHLIMITVAQIELSLKKDEIANYQGMSNALKRQFTQTQTKFAEEINTLNKKYNLYTSVNLSN